jgi:hypothetical protein
VFWVGWVQLIHPKFVRTAGMGPEKYFLERFNKFLTNDWVHLERKVASLEAKVHMLLAGSGIIIGLMVYAVTK